MLWRLAAFYILMVPLELGVLAVSVKPSDTLPGVGMEAAVGAVFSLLLAPVFNTIVSFLIVKRLGRLSGFGAALVNVAGFELLNLVLADFRDMPTRMALPFDLVKLAVPWALSFIPWIRRRVLARPRPKAREALFGASASAFAEGDDVGQVLALTDPIERGARAVLHRRPPAWAVSGARLGEPPRVVSPSLSFSLLTAGSSAVGWSVLAFGLVCASLLPCLDRMRILPVEMEGVDAVARIVDCSDSPSSNPLAGLVGDDGRHTLRYRYQVKGVEYEGLRYDDHYCPEARKRWTDPDDLPLHRSIRIRYWPRHPERSLVWLSWSHESFIWTVVLLLGALVGIRAGLRTLFEAFRGIQVLRDGRLVEGAIIPGFAVALSSGPKRFVPVLAFTPARGRLLVEVLEPRTRRSSTGPSLLVPDSGPIVPWDQLPVVPDVDAAGQPLGPRRRTSLVPPAIKMASLLAILLAILPALAAALGAVAVASWLRLLGR